ncbi:cupin domain-containing protein [Canibacter zhoujuaniae]|uniref:cupin domain-containing protein n=1 Tax=Canibacter zhoujuaniae TaxID=2708343 RepID=UPI0014201936|nr:cupin domain-containing protein [Canibacter zhoujuaniae]
MFSLPSELTAQQVIETLSLEPLPHEGGYFKRTHSSPHSSAIYYLLQEGDFSALHSLTETEVYHWYAGSPLEILVLLPDGESTVHRLGPNIIGGELPQAVIPAGATHGSRPLGAWSLVGTTMSPPFTWEGFALGDAAMLTLAYPQHAQLIRKLTR